jgi:hypothetical protein
MSFFRIGQSNQPIPDKLCRSDYYQIVTSTLMLVMGAVILIRSIGQNITLMTFLVGGGFLALGAYRLSFVIKYIKGKRKCSRR